MKNAKQEHIDLIAELILIINRVHNANNSDELKELGQYAYQFSENVEPVTVSYANGESKLDFRGKEMLLEILKETTNAMGRGDYADIRDEKFALASSIRILFGAFVHLSEEDLNIMRNNLS